MQQINIKKYLKENTVKGKLSNEKQKELFLQYEEDKKNGVPLDKSDARTILILANEPLIKYCINLLVYNDEKPNEDSDIYNEGKLGLIHAVDTFYTDNKITFSTYACYTIKIYMLRYFQHKKKTVPTVFYQDLITEDLEKEFTLEPADDFTMDEVTEELDLKSFISNCFAYFKYLKPEEQKLILLRHGLLGNKEHSFRSIAKLENKSNVQTRINQHNLALRKLKLLLTDIKNLSTDEKKKLKHILAKEYKIIPEVKKYLLQQEESTCLVGR